MRELSIFIRQSHTNQVWTSALIDLQNKAMIRLGSDKNPIQKFEQLLQPELPECAFSITLQDGGEDLNTVSNIPALYICLCEVTDVGQDKGAKPG